MERGRGNNRTRGTDRSSRPLMKMCRHEALVKKSYPRYHSIAKKHRWTGRWTGRWSELYRELESSPTQPETNQDLFSACPLLTSLLIRDDFSNALKALTLCRYDLLTKEIIAKLAPRFQEKLIAHLQAPELIEELDRRFDLFTGEGYSLGGSTVVATACLALLAHLQRKGKKLTSWDLLAALRRRDLEILQLLLPGASNDLLIGSWEEVPHILCCYIPYKVAELDFVLSNYTFEEKILSHVYLCLLRTSPLLNPAMVKAKEVLLERVYQSREVAWPDLSAAIEGEDLFWVERLSLLVPEVNDEWLNTSVQKVLQSSSSDFSAVGLFQILDRRDVRMICRPEILLQSVVHPGLTAYLLEEHQELRDQELIWRTLVQTTKVSSKQISCGTANYLLKTEKFPSLVLASTVILAAREGREDLVEIFRAHLPSDIKVTIGEKIEVGMEMELKGQVETKIEITMPKEEKM